MTTMRVVVPGAVYNECFDPEVSGYAEMVDLPEPQAKRRGKGHQYVYHVSPELHADMLNWADTVASPFRQESDPYLRRAARAIDAWVKQENGRIEHPVGIQHPG